MVEELISDIPGALLGQTLYGVHVGKEVIDMITRGGQHYRFAHRQDCCESVYVEDVEGDIADLLDTPLLRVEVAEDQSDETGDDSRTWTFYKFATTKGRVTIRWLGESNGYYSESVDLYEVKEE